MRRRSGHEGFDARLRLMKVRPRHALLLAALLAQTALLFRSSAWTVRVARRAAGMSLDQRRLMMFGGFYDDILRIRGRVPPGATLWVVSANFPLHVNYFLYPRTLRFGSNAPGDLEKLRALHPQDWTLTHQSGDPTEDRITVYPPTGKTP